MKLTLQIKLLPDVNQASNLLATLRQANAACNRISQTAWDMKIFNSYRLHHAAYRTIRDTTRLSAQAVVRCIAKVADAYKISRTSKRRFKTLGGISYDSRILSYKADMVSIWTVAGRLKIPFVCHNPRYLPYIKGEADLVYKKGKFFLFQTIEVPEDKVNDVEEFIGVDFGILDIATTSDGESFASENLNRVRDKYFRTRRSVQAKRTRGAKKLLKRLAGRERRHAIIINHTISKRIVSAAKESSRGIAIENLKNIHQRIKVRKSQRLRHSNWAFGQLRNFLEYKARLAGVPLVVIRPAYTSQTCHRCKHIGHRNGKRFECPKCGMILDADINAAINISHLGASVNRPEKNQMYCSIVHLAS